MQRITTGLNCNGLEGIGTETGETNGSGGRVFMIVARGIAFVCGNRTRTLARIRSQQQEGTDAAEVQ
jgi:hypothetical protein